MILTLQVYSFEQFLRICDSGALELYREAPFPNYGYERLISLFHQYCLVGGISDVVEQYHATHSLGRLSPLYEKQLERLFARVVSIASTRKTKDRLLQLYQDAFAFAATRITYNRFSQEEYRSREVGHAFRLLEKHRLLRLIYPTTQTILPWHIARNRAPRIQLPDTGLVNYFTGIQQTLAGLSDLSAVFNRQISLHIVAQELLNPGVPEDAAVHFWVRNKTQSAAQVDFVIAFQAMMIPVEVKTGEPGRLRSLHQFLDEAPHPFAIRLYAGPLAVRECRTIRGKTFFLMSLPYFLAGKIREHLEGFIKFVGREEEK